MKQVTHDQLDELARLEAGATPGEWYGQFTNGSIVTGEGHPLSDIAANDERGTLIVAFVADGENDRNFICAARNALPALLAELRLLRKLGTELEHAEMDGVLLDGEASKAFTAWRESKGWVLG